MVYSADLELVLGAVELVLVAGAMESDVGASKLEPVVESTTDAVGLVLDVESTMTDRPYVGI